MGNRPSRRIVLMEGNEIIEEENGEDNEQVQILERVCGLGGSTSISWKSVIHDEIPVHFQHHNLTLILTRHGKVAALTLRLPPTMTLDGHHWKLKVSLPGVINSDE